MACCRLPAGARDFSKGLSSCSGVQRTSRDLVSKVPAREASLSPEAITSEPRKSGLIFGHCGDSYRRTQRATAVFSGTPPAEALPVLAVLAGLALSTLSSALRCRRLQRGSRDARNRQPATGNRQPATFHLPPSSELLHPASLRLQQRGQPLRTGHVRRPGHDHPRLTRTQEPVDLRHP